MKTHRQALIEKLDNEFGKTVNATQATIEHLLMFADVLDEREEAARFSSGQTKAPSSIVSDDVLQAAAEYANKETGSKSSSEDVDCARAALAKASTTWQFCVREFVKRIPNKWDGMDQFPDVTKKVETPAECASHSFPDEIVERCRIAQQTAIRDALSKHGECHPDVGLLAVFAELAKTPMDELLPSVNDLRDAYEQAHAASRMAHADELSSVGVDAILARVAQDVDPVFAAKDAMIMSLQNEADNRLRNAEDLGGQLRFARDMVAAQAKRIAELESHAATIKAQAAQYKAERDHVEETCRMHSAKVIELEKRLAIETVNANLYRKACDKVDLLPGVELYDAIDAIQRREDRAHRILSDAGIPSVSATGQGYSLSNRIGTLIENRDKHSALRDELEKRIASLTAPMVVDGKTPGHELWNRLRHCFPASTFPGSKPWEFVDEDTRAMMERIANAVLRAFGNGVEALKEIRKQIGDAPGEAAEYYQSLIDIELATLGSAPQSPSALNKLRKKFTYDAESGHSERWVLRADVLNAIDEIAKLA